MCNDCILYQPESGDDIVVFNDGQAETAIVAGMITREQLEKARTHILGHITGIYYLERKDNAEANYNKSKEKNTNQVQTNKHGLK